VASGSVGYVGIGLLADGSVVVAGGARIGSFASPCYTGCIDASTGIVAALCGVHEHEPGRSEWPRSTTLLIGSLHSGWAPKAIELRTPAAAVGVVAGQLVAVDTHQGPMRVVTISTDGKPDAVETFPASLLGFAGSRGIVAHSLDRRREEAATVTLLAPPPG
jgi:hypothetical protein